MSCALSDAVGFRAALAAAGLPRAQDFSVAETAQFVEASTLAQVVAFIEVFDRVTARDAGRAACAKAPPAGSGAFDPSQTRAGSSALWFRQSGGGPQRRPIRTSGGT